MLNYLTGSTRPDIAMAVHQIARFSNNPKLSHEKSIMRICRYLIGTADKGMIFKPDKTKGLELYVDADFAGNWKNAGEEHPENCMSRTGYLIRYNGCNIMWKSQLQTEITLSTAESEYVALSQALRPMIPVINLLEDFHKIFPEVSLQTPKVNVTVYEDNTSCIVMSQADKFTPRTKHITLKYHWFKEYAKNGLFNIEHVDTKLQLADIFTKPLDEVTFKRLRFLVCGY